MVASVSGITKVYLVGKRYCFSRADLFNWVGAPGNSGLSVTISATNPSSVRPFCLSTHLPGADCPLGEEGLVDTPSEDELLDKLSEEELEEAPAEVELELVGPPRPSVWVRIELKRDYLFVRRPDSVSRLGLRHSSNLKISHTISSDDLLGIIHLHLWAEDIRGGGMDHERVLGSKGGHSIGNLFGFPTFILVGDIGHHAAINKGWEARELLVPTLHLRAGQTLRNIPTV
ncbi:hypothetical protein Cgig2_023438 [Carnegiea gigantea]|uniref:Uncharacterized protein n=1 Tax=Carnegiea gigantea TaxID=171969 RepID=A0A9Q1GMY4_9CARY|nr:hypothetical protein Cgig2_023438 [Carnegiea gigantea]